MKKKVISKWYVFVMVAVLALAFLPVFQVRTKAEEIAAPLDFTVEDPAVSGPGWTWDGSAKTLTLNGLVLDLTKYSEEYDGAIALPDDSTVVVSGENRIAVSGMVNENDGHTALFSLGNLTITGDGTLATEASNGAEGVYCGKELSVSGTGEGLNLLCNGSTFVLGAEEKLTLDNTSLTSELYGSDNEFAYPAVLIVANNGDLDAGDVLTIKSSWLSFNIHGMDSQGIITFYGNVVMDDTYASIQAAEDASYTRIIQACNGSISIENKSLVTLDTTANGKANGTMLVANYIDPKCTLSRSITISDSEVYVHSAGGVLDASFGKIDILNSAVGVESGQTAFFGGPLGINIDSSGVWINSANGFYTSAIRCNGPMNISNSYVYAEISGEHDNGLNVNNGSTLTISGEDTVVELVGDRAGLELSADKTLYPSKDAPYVLSDGLEAVEGGTLQRVEGSDNMVFWSYSESTLSVDENNNVVNAATYVKIAKPEEISYKVSSDTQTSWTRGSSAGLTFKIERNINNETTFAHYTGAAVDGKALTASDCDVASGSLILTLKPAYLENIADAEAQ